MEARGGKGMESAGVQRDLSRSACLLQAALGEVRGPLCAALIVICQANPMGPVSHPVHKAERPTIQKALVQMIFDQNERAAHTRCLSQQRRNVPRVMQYVH